MKAIVLVRNDAPEKAFELREMPQPTPGEGEVLIRNHGFGLNYADVLARKGLYNDCPPLPTVLGYEVVGTVEAVGQGVTSVQPGQRVIGFCRFGGYAEFTVTGEAGVSVLPEGLSEAEGAALGTQYCTAYHAAMDQTNLHPGDRVLVHAAAGGVGTALVQLARARGCIVYGTVGSEAKMAYAKAQGADHVINYRKEDFETAMRKLLGEHRLDVVFDAVGGQSFKKGLALLGAGGRLVSYGVANWSDSNGGLLAKLRLVFGFGFLHPLGLLMKSKAVIGVNMLRIADHKPGTIQRCLTAVVGLASSGKIQPQVGGTFPADRIADAHALLESRKSTGKVYVHW
ncbi:MAG: zinc-binding dehydrogenase [Bacteroidota bacterium]